MTERTIEVSPECMDEIETAVARSSGGRIGMLERLDISVRGLKGIDGNSKSEEQLFAIRAAAEAVLDTHPACPKGNFGSNDALMAVVSPNAPRRDGSKGK